MSAFTHPLVAWRRLRLLPRWVRRVDASAARAINARGNRPRIDRALSRLSHAADRSRLWFGIAIGLHLLGGARRRAAVRGIASLVIGSAVANLVGKRLFGGERPMLKDVPVPRRLKRMPTSAAFPSGHAASAAAFVTGVAVESPRSGAALAPLAGAVAYSRVHSGAHWPSDVVGGALLGVTVGVLGRLLVKGGPRPDPVHRDAAIPLPALPEGEGLLILANPLSGIDPRRPDPVVFLEAELPRARVHPIAEGETIAELVATAVAAATPPRVIGIWGGDGSVAAAADAARGAGLPLLVFPCGTFNHFARTAGAETIDDALVAVRTGSGKRVDVAELVLDEAHTVLNVASVGIYPAFVAERERIQRTLGKPAAALIAAATVLAHAKTVDVRVDGRPAQVWSVAVAAGENSSASMMPLQRRRLDDGVLDVRLLHARGRMPRLRGIIALAFGARASSWLDRLPIHARLKTIESFMAQQVHIEVRPAGGDDVVVAHDGEVTVVQNGCAAVGLHVRIAALGLDVYGLEWLKLT